MNDVKKIEELFRSNYAGLFRLAVAMVRDEETARDIVHDVFASLLESRQRPNCKTDITKPPSEPPTAGYLSSMVHNRCINHIRRMEVGRRVSQMIAYYTEDTATADWPDEQTFREIQRIVETDLSPIQQRIIELRFTAGLPFAEIAKQTGISQTAVFGHLRKALSTIRTKLISHGLF